MALCERDRNEQSCSAKLVQWSFSYLPPGNAVGRLWGFLGYRVDAPAQAGVACAEGYVQRTILYGCSAISHQSYFLSGSRGGGRVRPSIDRGCSPGTGEGERRREENEVRRCGRRAVGG